MYMLVVITTGLLGVISYLYYLLKGTGASTAGTSLDAYISAEPCVKPQPERENKNRPPRYSGIPGRQVLIMFATEYGFSEELANLLLERLTKMAESSSRKWQPRVLNAKHHQLVQWDKETICFFIMSTCGDGAVPTESRSFLTFLQNCQQDFQHLHVSVLALGDSSYPHYCKAGLSLAHRLEEMGTASVVSMTKVDGEDWTVIEGWFDKLEAWLKSSVAELAVPDLSLDYLDTAIAQDNSTDSYSRHNPFMATLKTKRLLTQVEDVLLDRETIHCDLDISGSDLEWTPGDSVGICPMNNTHTVEAILSLLGLTGQEILPVSKPAFRGQGQLSIREALLWYYDIRKVTMSTLSAVSHHFSTFIHNNTELDRILGSTKECSKYMESRNLVQMLEDWCGYGLAETPSVETVFSLLKTLRPLQPRYYSISSSPLQDKSSLSVTVAVVRYLLNGRQEGGVTTTHLQDQLQVGQQLPVFISANPDFRLPTDPNVPVILIGAGTGLAPFLAFTQERELLGIPGEIHLYFGCRHPDKDFLYRQQLETWEKKGFVRLRAAFSRYFQHKVYVQDLLAEDAELVWALIEKAGGVLYVCGDASHLAPDVHNTLVTIVQQQGHLSQEEAQSYLKDLEQAGRYQKDVWVS